MVSETLTRQTASYPPAEIKNQIQKNIEGVQNRIAAACSRSGRNPANVTLLPISKTVDQHRIRWAHDMGCQHFGENKVQELRTKSDQLKDLDIRWHMVGHLQSNKARVVAKLAHGFHALDSLKVAKLLDQHLQREGRCLEVLIQVNSSGESTKFGLRPEDVPAFVHQLTSFSALKIKGLMTLAVFSSDWKHVRRCFVKMRELRERLRQESPENFSFDELSMGMSDDYQIAIEEGATIIRVGQAIFGSRSIPNAHYWPERDHEGDDLPSTIT